MTEKRLIEGLQIQFHVNPTQVILDIIDESNGKLVMDIVFNKDYFYKKIKELIEYEKERGVVIDE